jgi:hypothetical protein
MNIKHSNFIESIKKLEAKRAKILARRFGKTEPVKAKKNDSKK